MKKISVYLFTFIFTILISLTVNGTSFASTGDKPSAPSRYTLDKIEFKFETTKSFDEDDLENIMNLPRLATYSEQELEQDRLRIKKYYFDNGFFDAVFDTASSYDKEDLSVLVTIIIIL